MRDKVRSVRTGTKSTREERDQEFVKTPIHQRLVHLMREAKTIEQQWEHSPERSRALRDFLTRVHQTGHEGTVFPYSGEYANGRNAFRKRVNNSPWAETT